MRSRAIDTRSPIPAGCSIESLSAGARVVRAQSPTRRRVALPLMAGVGTGALRPENLPAGNLLSPSGPDLRSHAAKSAGMPQASMTVRRIDDRTIETRFSDRIAGRTSSFEESCPTREPGGLRSYGSSFTRSPDGPGTQHPPMRNRERILPTRGLETIMAGRATPDSWRVVRRRRRSRRERPSHPPVRSGGERKVRSASADCASLFPIRPGSLSSPVGFRR